MSCSGFPRAKCQDNKQCAWAAGKRGPNGRRKRGSCRKRSPMRRPVGLMSPSQIVAANEFRGDMLPAAAAFARRASHRSPLAHIARSASKNAQHARWAGAGATVAAGLAGLAGDTARRKQFQTIAKQNRDMAKHNAQQATVAHLLQQRARSTRAAEATKLRRAMAARSPYLDARALGGGMW